MSLPKTICSYLEDPDRKAKFDAVYVEPYLCDDCYKVKCLILESLTPSIPNRCLLNVIDYEIISSPQGVTLTILKAVVKSKKVQDHSNYLCLADHSVQVVQALQKHKHSHIVQKYSLDESQIATFPDAVLNTANPIGFGLNSSEKSLRFEKQRTKFRIIESQDDILNALPCVESKQDLQIEMFKDKDKNKDKDKAQAVGGVLDGFGNYGEGNVGTGQECDVGDRRKMELVCFPDWAVAYLMVKYGKS